MEINALRERFCENFNMGMIASELMDLMDEEVLETFIYGEFNENFTYGELYDLFKDYISKEDLTILLKDMGHDFVDLDNLTDEEKEKYY